MYRTDQSSGEAINQTLVNSIQSALHEKKNDHLYEHYFFPSNTTMSVSDLGSVGETDHGEHVHLALNERPQFLVSYVPVHPGIFLLRAAFARRNYSDLFS